MDNQFKFDFSPAEKISTDKEESFDHLSDTDLKIRYKKDVGYSPRVGLKRDALIKAIQDPEAELERLSEIDTESNKEDLKAPYSGKSVRV